MNVQKENLLGGIKNGSTDMVWRCRYLQAEAHQAGITPPKLQSSKLSSALPHALWWHVSHTSPANT